jgi:hypothetical protein
VTSTNELAQAAHDVVVSLETSDLGLGCRLATPWLASCPKLGPVHTRCHLDGAPPSLTAHYSAPLAQQGVRLFSTADPPEVACDIMLLSAAPPTREAYLLESGQVALLTWVFTAELGALRVSCEATVHILPPEEHDLGVYQLQALSALPGVILQGMAHQAEAESFLRHDVRALSLLVAATKSGVELALTAQYLLYHVDVADEYNALIVSALTYLPPAILSDLKPRIEEAGLRAAVEDAFIEHLGRPRSWLEPLLVERLAVFHGADMDERIVDLLASGSSPWIAWWLLARAMEAVGNVRTASRLACGALEKLPTSQKTIELLERCAQPEAVPAIAQAVAWMRLQGWHRRASAEDVLGRLCSPTEAEGLIRRATDHLQQGTHSSSRVQTRR